MAPYERGSADKDDMRVFDGGEDEAEPEGSGLPVLIISCLIILAAFGGVVWLAYNQGVVHGRNDVPRVATTTVAQDAPAVAPGAGDSSSKPIKVYQQPAGPDESADQSPATAPPTPLTKPAPAKPQPSEQAQSAPAVEKPAPPVEKPAPPVTVAPPSPPKPKPVASAPVAAAPVAAAPSAAPGAYVLQIGAYKSGADAEAAWKEVQGKHAALLSGISHDIQKADLGEKGVWYRLRAGSFADKTSAAALCDKLKADGGVCFPAK
jgi:cell division protein FtsN